MVSAKELALELKVCRNRIYQLLHGWSSGGRKYKPIFVEGIHYKTNKTRVVFFVEKCKKAYIKYKGEKNV
jgi:hypothetical protein